jgi:3-oxoacyl-[acyl-carrier protein] reductase
VKPRALITGAARGIGAAIARELALNGFPVIINYRSNHAQAEQVQRSILNAGGSAKLWACDVTDAPSVEQGLKDLLSEAPISVLVNNAGVLKDAPFPALEPEDWHSVTRTTLDGFYNVTRPLMMPMARRRWGRIVNISSVSGVIGNRGQTNYSAAKAGLIGATRSLALEFARRNITVNAVAPGLIDTDMIKDSPVDEIVSHIPMRRLGRVEEVAKLVAYLVSDDAAYITGQVIGINGGLA